MDLSRTNLSVNLQCYYSSDSERNSVPNRREIRCEHGFICDPIPDSGSKWLCPRCRCPWPHDKRKAQGLSGRILSLLESRKITSTSELFELLEGEVSWKQMQNAISNLRCSGYDVPNLEKRKPKKP